MSGSRNSKVIREMMRKEMKWREKSKRSEATLTVRMKHEDDYRMNGDSDLCHSVRTSKQGRPSLTDNKEKRQRKTKNLQCMMAHALASTTLTDFPSVSRHLTNCWAFRSALRVNNSNNVAVPIYSISDLYANSLLRFTLRKWSCEVLPSHLPSVTIDRRQL